MRSKSFALTLAPGAYRFRTVEAGGEADADIGGDGVIPQVIAHGSDISLEPNGHADELVVRNDTDRSLFFVVENRNWAQDALTGERVIAMPAFRRLCPEQLLRPATTSRSAASRSCSPTCKARPNSTTISAMPPPTAWCAIISPFCRSG